MAAGGTAARGEGGSGWERETRAAERFRFGENWASFLRLLNDNRIQSAEDSLNEMLGTGRLDGLTFLDIGSGSGLFSLAARRLGANVCSFDYDPQSVACTNELRQRYFPDDSHWRVESGSVLDEAFVESLGRFDVVYSWGVLHHTGAMWEALDHVCDLVAPGGRLFIAIYNDQGLASRYWARVKRSYLSAPAFLKPLIFGASLAALWGPAALRKLLGGRRAGTTRSAPRGMDRLHDARDWIGGYPFEVARPEEILDFYRPRGFELIRLKTCAGRIGCNEYVFARAG